MGSADRLLREVLMKAKWPLWAVAIAVGALRISDEYRIIVPVSLMALAGTLCEQIRERDLRGGKTGSTADVAELLLRVALATRSQPDAEAGLRLVADDGERQSGLPAQRQSAG